MALQDTLYEELRHALPGSTDYVIKVHLRAVVDEFCRFTDSWRETIEVTLIVDEDVYEITPVGTTILNIYRISHETLDVSGAIYDQGQISLGTAPGAAHVMTPLYVEASLTLSLPPPADVESWIPADMWLSAHEALNTGVKARMMALNAKPWSDATKAVYHRREFMNKMANARHEVLTGGAPDRQYWLFPRWA